MYLGGSIINASECDYQSSRELGCKCPCCGEAVFLRAGVVRQTTLRNKQKALQVVNPAFVHYKKDVVVVSCEKRFHTKEAREKTEVFEIQGRNQRLKLYNHKLFEILKNEHEWNKSQSISIKKFIGGKYVDAFAKKVHEQAVTAGEELTLKAEDAFKTILSKKTYEEAVSEKIQDYYPKPGGQKSYDYYFNYFKHQCDCRLHLKICLEIVSFLQTQTSSYIWQKLAPYLLGMFFSSVDQRLLSNDKTHLKKVIDATLCQKPICFPMVAINFVITAHLIDRINQEVNYLTLTT
jgi:hypothetical protein